MPKYGIVGFGWGCGRSSWHATMGPVVGLHGGNAARMNATIPTADSTLNSLGKSYETPILEGAGQGCLRGQDGSTPNTAAAVWPRTVAFFRAKLGR